MGGRTRPVQPMPDDIGEELESSGRVADQRARGRPAGAWPTSGRMADQRLMADQRAQRLPRLDRPGGR